jgi:hypothetical protein
MLEPSEASGAGAKQTHDINNPRIYRFRVYLIENNRNRKAWVLLKPVD